ncbi:MAG: hypothetical protein JO147_00880 [Actinobacteria bacterium]|nr:hypothetical protein [Actinomycetota bacterium]
MGLPSSTAHRHLADLVELGSSRAGERRLPDRKAIGRGRSAA